jgi:hypothetical protein
MPVRASLAIILLIILASPAAAGERIWTYTNGQTVRAEFISEVDGEVTLLKDGKLVTVKADQLSEADRLVVKELAAGRDVPGNLPDAPAENKGTKTADQPPALVPAGEEKPIKGKPIPIVNRVWTDVFGNQTTAKFVRIVGSDVVLMRSTRPITVRFYDLTTTDQEYLKELLTSQGKEALIPPPLPMPTEQPQGAAPAAAPGAPPAEPAAPAASAPPSIPQPPDLPTPGSGAARASAIFDEMQKRSAERMAEHRQRSQERMRDMRDMVHGPPSAAPAGRVTEDGTTGSSGTLAPSTDKSSTASVDSQTVAQTRQIVIIGLVVVGVLGTVAVIVFVAITIAAASSASRQRQYR